MLVLDELAGGMLEDLTELWLSTPSTDFVSCSTLLYDCEPLFLLKVWILSTYLVLVYALTYLTYLRSW